jgi:hypothetical protein
MTLTIGIWAIPCTITVVTWLWAYIKDRSDPDLGQLWAFAAAGATVSSWVFYLLLWVVII